MIWERKNTCCLCKTNIVTESVTEDIFTGDIPDQSNCDFSTYRDYMVNGGRLLVKPQPLRMHTRKDVVDVVCSTCLEQPDVAILMKYVKNYA